MNGMFYALVIFCLIDWVVSALRYGIVDKSLTSKKLFRNAFEKLLIFVLVGIGNIVDRSILQHGQVLREAVIFFYVSAEGLKILEHVNAMGLPVPRKLSAILKDPEEMDKPKGNDNEKQEG